MAKVENVAAAPLASSALYENDTEKLVLTLRNGVEVRIPAKLLQGIREASPEQRAAFAVTANGRAIHWDGLDIHLSVEGLLQGLYGTRSWMQDLQRAKPHGRVVDTATIGRSGGKVKSEAKAKAAALNGAKGGRPKKTAAAA